VFVDDLEGIPSGAVVVFSAHGVSPEVRSEAATRHLRVIDATCPLVTKVHLEAVRYVRDGYVVVLIGHRGHDEVVGTLGEAPGAIQLISSVEEVDSVVAPDPQRVAYLTQTTLSVDDTRYVINRLRARFPALVGPGDQDICYATQNRQTAVKVIAARAQVILVGRGEKKQLQLEPAGRSCGTGWHAGVPSLNQSATSNPSNGLAGCTRIGVTAGASTPDHLVAEVLDLLHRRGDFVAEHLRSSRRTVAIYAPA